MDPRIHAALEGDLPEDALSPAERAELAHLRATLAAVRGSLRAAEVPELTARVMGSLPERRHPRAATRLLDLLRWVWEPRPVRLRPAYALLLTAAVALPGLPRAQQGPAGPPQEESGPTPVLVQFRLSAPGARSVALAGTFTDWRPAVQLRQTAPGEWSALVPMRPGVHDYAFVVDGQRWVADPHAPEVDDSFGGTNSRLSLPPVTLQS